MRKKPPIAGNCVDSACHSQYRADNGRIHNVRSTIGAWRSKKGMDVLNRGLTEAADLAQYQKQVQNEYLLRVKAIILALDGDYAGSLVAQKAAGYPQHNFVASIHQAESSRYAGLADLLLGRGKPEVALMSLGGQELTEYQSEQRLVMAKARRY